MKWKVVAQSNGYNLHVRMYNLLDYDYMLMNGIFVRNRKFVQQEIQFYAYAVLSLAHLKNENKNR